MFQWYCNSQVCYPYLSDVPEVERHHEPNSSFRCSQWFKRGWTLQELLAPETVVFFNRNWVGIGTKSSLAPVILSITPISIAHLQDCESASIAQKMSWAARCITITVEDTAYSLPGLFGINMPPLYGEGLKRS